MAKVNMKKDTSVIVTKIYPIVSNSLDKNSAALQKCIGRFVTSRYNELYDTAPCSRILFGNPQMEDFYNSIKINEKDILAHLQNAFFWGVPYNPPQIKEPFVATVLMCIRYYMKKSDKKMTELCTIYLAFSGKFYASLHGKQFPKCPPSEYRSVMDYVVNNKLSGKFDLRKEGTVFGAIRSLCLTWIDTYSSFIKGAIDDDGCGTVIQQLRDREKSFMINISRLYYEAYENKEYLNFESDNYEDGTNFRIADNDATVAERITNTAVHYLTTTSVDFKVCSNMCADQNVTGLEIKDIIESIVSEKTNIELIREVCNILITDFMKNNKGKPVHSLDFIAYSIKAKPNTKNKNLIRLKTIILSWLDENSAQYRKRKNRPATAISYYKCILKYFVIIINRVAA